MSDEALVIALIIIARMYTTRVNWGLSSEWSWPIPDIATSGAVPFMTAIISQEYRGGGDRPHYGVDLMYRSVAGGSTAPNDRVPVPVLAARRGTVWSVAWSRRGWQVVIDHGAPFATFYAHLSSVSVGKGQTVNAGDQIGVMGADPTDEQHVRHLHFAVWYRGHGDDSSVDPMVQMSEWRRSIWKP